MSKYLRALALATVLVAFAGIARAESLAKTGGFVPVDAPALAFEGITISDLGSTYIPVARLAGGSVNSKYGEALPYHEDKAADSVTYQYQMVDGSNVNCVFVRFTNADGGGVNAQATLVKYSSADALGTDLSNANNGTLTTSADGTGYGVCGLGLVPMSQNSINVNIAYNNNKLATDSAYAGARKYVQPLSHWDNVNSVAAENVSLSGGETVAISGVPNSGWRCSSLSSSYSLQYGYLDENNNLDNSCTPTVAISGIGYARYRVVAYASTDTGDAQFGYITINDVDYTSTYQSTSTAFGTGFAATPGTANWGHAGADQYALPLAEGVNYLVSLVTSGATATVVGHRQSGSVRGCIAAVQVVQVPLLTAPAGEVEWSTAANWDVSSAPSSGDAVILVSGDTTLDIDVALSLDSLIIEGSGTLALKASDIDANTLGTLSIADGVTLVIDATEGYTVGTNVKALLHDGAGARTVVVKGAGERGLSMPLSSYAEQYNFTTHAIFDGGKHVITDTYEDGNTQICANSSNTDPLWTVAAGTTLDISAHDLGGYQGAGKASTCVIAAKAGGTININGDGSHTFYYQGRFLIEPGATLNVAAQSSDTGFRINGGTAEGEEQFYVPDQEEATAAVATLANTSGGTSGAVCSATDSTPGFGVYVGENATLDWRAPIRNGNGASAIFKRGAGTWRLSGDISGYTGVLTVDAGDLVFASDNTLNTTIAGSVKVASGATLTLNSGASAGSLDLSDGGTLNIVATVNPATTIRIPVGDALTVGGGTVQLNGEAIDTETWAVVGGNFVNKNLLTAVTTAEGDFAFSTATWKSALGEDVDWTGSLSEVRVHANNAEPATATVDLNAAQVSTFAVDGAGDMTFSASGSGAINAAAFDFSASTGRIEYTFPTGSAAVTSGADTILSGGGSGVPSVAAGKRLTLGAWGTTSDDATYTYADYFRPAAGATLVISPGEGKTQKASGFGGTDSGTLVVVTNGTLVANVGSSTGYFGYNRITIENGGILRLDEVIDTTGYGNTSQILTINEGGLLDVCVRDTLRRPVVLNGGAIQVSGKQSSRALDFYYANTITVTANSEIRGVAGGADADQSGATVDNPVIWFRDADTVFNIGDGVTLANNVTYGSFAAANGFTVRGTTGNGTGVMKMNGFDGNPITVSGTNTVGASGKPVTYELNCEHQNGVYVVTGGSRMRGTGSVTGTGGVTLSKAASKLCGTLGVNSLTATAGGTFGDSWNPVALVLDGAFTAGAGTFTIENGSLTIGAECSLTDVGSATFSIQTNGTLVVRKSLTVAGLSIASNESGTGSLHIGVAADKSVSTLVATAATLPSNVELVIDYGSKLVIGLSEIRLLTLPTSAATGTTFTVVDNLGARKWGAKVVANGDGTSTVVAIPKNGYTVILR